MMKKYILLFFLFLLTGTFISAQNITRLEYSIDGFVAEGNGTVIEIPGNTTELNTDFNIDISGLEPGNHIIHFRAMNEDGVWSYASERSFYIPEPSIEDGIVAMEYSIDEMDKEGEGIPINVEEPTNLFIDDLQIDISDLEAGNHFIYMRSKNKYGIWSQPVSKSFVIVKPDTTKIEHVKYRFYNESYNGAWMTASVDPARKNVDSIFMFSTAGLDLQQDYSIEIYAKNNEDVRGYSVFLNSVDLQINNSPNRLRDTLEIAMNINQQIDIQLDTLFDDADLFAGDSLIYSITGANDENLMEFTNWNTASLLTFLPGSQNAGSYEFWLKASDLAGETDSVFVELTVNDITGIDTELEQNAFRVFPNPVNDVLTITNPGNYLSGYELRIYTSDGRLRFIDQVNTKEYNLSLREYPQGIYILNIINEDLNVQKKIIKN